MHRTTESLRRCLLRRLSWEAEDGDGFSRVLFHENIDHVLNKKFCLRKAIFANLTVGSRLNEDILDLHNSVMTLEGRIHSFPQNWNVISPLDMALAGLYYDSGKIRCHMCQVHFRTSPLLNLFPWSLHKLLAPTCLHLQRMMCGGPHPANYLPALDLLSSTSVLDKSAD